MEYKRLGDICEIKAGGTPSRSKKEYWENGNIPWIKISDINNKYVNSVSEYITEEGLNNSSAKLLKKGTILYTIFATLGEVGILEFDATTNQAIAGLEHNEEIDKNYLYYFLKSQKKIVSNIGRGVAQNNINLSILRDIKVPLPEKNMQIKIADILDKAQSLIDKKREQIDLLDELIKSRFIEMFGNPVSNSKEWKKQKINEVAPVSNYKGEFDEEKIWLLNLDMVESNSGRIIDFNYVDKEEIGSSTCTFDTSNVLYSKLRPYLNKVVIPDRIGYATSEMIPLKPNKKVLNREYLTYLLRNKSFVDYISEKVSGAKMPRVVMNDFKNFELPIPPIELQNEFAEFVTKIDEIKSKMETSLLELEDNFNSLMQSAFKGELFI